jgi:hypothetical protein
MAYSDFFSPRYEKLLPTTRGRGGRGVIVEVKETSRRPKMKESRERISLNGLGSLRY